MTCGRSGLALWHVDEYRLEAIVDDYVRTGDERHCRYKDFIAASPAVLFLESRQCYLQVAGAAVAHEAEPASMGGREFLFETRHHRLAVNRPLFNTSDTSSFGSGRDVHAADANLSARRLAMT